MCYVCVHIRVYLFAACREPKVSELVRQRVLPPQAPSRYVYRCIMFHSMSYRTYRMFFLRICPLNLRGNVCIHLASASHIRKTPVHKLYSSQRGQQLQSVSPTKGPVVLSQLPQGFHHLYTHIEYECASQFYQHSGSSRRTCLKTGKWSGLHVSCSPGEGSRGPPVFQSVDSRTEQTHWHTF